MTGSSPLWRVMAVGALVALSVTPTRAQDRQISVLALHEARREAPVPVVADPILQRVLGEGLSGRLDFYSESMDLTRFPDTAYHEAFQAFFLAKHAGRHFDVVVATTQAAFDFAIRHRDHLFPDSPIVFNAARPVSGELRNATGIVTPLTMRQTLESAIALQPETERVFVVSGVSPFDRNYEALARSEFKPLEGRLAFTYLAGLPVQELLKRVSSLPPRSILYWVSVTEDPTGQKFMSTEMVGRVSAAANAPMYAWVDIGTEHGVVGGRTVSIELAMQRLAEVALRVLRGERPETIPVARIDAGVTVFDWRQLQRWGISESRLPPGSTIRLRQPGAWELYRPQIVGGSLLLLLQSGLIAMLLFQRSRRRLAERDARETEQRFRHMMNRAPIMMWTARPDTALDYFNTTCLEFTGLPIERLLGAGWLDAVHPDDVDRCMATYVPACEARVPFHMEYRLRRADGAYRWVLDAGVPKYEPDGRFAGYVGSCIDITDRKEIEETLRQNEANLRESNRRIQDLAGRLIASQEVERARIARDLHDGLGQDLAGLSIALSALKRRAGSLPGGQELQGDVALLQSRTIAVANDVRHLSHDLHPSVLEHAGLVATMRAHCDELERQRDVRIAFASQGEFAGLDRDLALCLYRVAQEALRNVVTHAGARRADVSLLETGERIELVITDDGKGFDIVTARERNRGLGLVSMNERVRLAGGIVSLMTEINRGTTIRVQLVRARRPSSEAGSRGSVATV